MSNLTKLILMIVAALLFVYALFAFDVPYRNTVNDFATCAAAGYAISQTYPETCTDSKGNMYVQDTEQASDTPMTATTSLQMTATGTVVQDINQ